MDEYILSKHNSWIKAAVQSIMSRRKFEMQWQLGLIQMAQPILSEEAARQRGDMVNQLLNVLQDNSLSAKEEDDSELLDLLKRAGRMPVREIHAEPKAG